MREIKFRAWDGEEKEMRYFDLSDVYYDDISHMPRMQYTGLHDKNGKEIYEGDLLIDTDPEPCRHRIVWLDDRAKFELETLLEDGDWDSGLYDNLEYYPEGEENKLTEFEIIGNIYENPELINPK